MYAKVTGSTVDQFPYTFADLRADNPNVSFPKNPGQITLSDWGVAEVTQQADPVYDPSTHKLEQGTPVLVGQDWQVTRQQVALTAEEITDYNKRTARQQDIDALKADPQVLTLLQARPDQINTYIDNNVTDLASAKEVIKIIARAVAVVAYTVVN